MPHVEVPTQDCMQLLQKILEAKLVISGSLHGIIAAEAFGVPAILLRLTNVEPLFKYHDYYAGTGRAEFRIAYSLEEAIRLGGEVPPICDLDLLMESFPYDQFIVDPCPLQPMDCSSRRVEG